MPGIAETSALQILAELAVLAPDLEARQWVAYAGLDPRQYSSGSSVQKKTRISKAGNKHLRRARYLPALVAVQHDPHLRAFYQHLRERGKLKMQALVAGRRKLLHAFHARFKIHQPFAGSKLVRRAASPVQEVARAHAAAGTPKRKKFPPPVKKEKTFKSKRESTRAGRFR